jgi:hypothetical protein
VRSELPISVVLDAACKTGDKDEIISALYGIDDIIEETLSKHRDGQGEG